MNIEIFHPFSKGTKNQARFSCHFSKIPIEFNQGKKSLKHPISLSQTMFALKTDVKVWELDEELSN